MLGVQQEGPGAFTVDYTVLQADFSPLDALDWSENEAGYQLGFTPQITGEHIVSIVITNAGTTALEPPVAPLVLSLMVTPLPLRTRQFSPSRTAFSSMNQI